MIFPMKLWRKFPKEFLKEILLWNPQGDFVEILQEFLKRNPSAHLPIKSRKNISEENLESFMKFAIEILEKIVPEDSSMICLTKSLRKISGDCENWPCVNKERNKERLWVQNADFFLAKKIQRKKSNTNRNMLDIFEMKEQEIKIKWNFDCWPFTRPREIFRGKIRDKILATNNKDTWYFCIERI